MILAIPGDKIVDKHYLIKEGKPSRYSLPKFVKFELRE